MKNFIHTLFCIVFFFAIHLNAQTTNVDFEATPAGVYTTSNAVSGWTISSQTSSSYPVSTIWTPGSPEFSIVTTPIISFPVIGNILTSPLGGSHVARLNNSTANRSFTKLTRNYFVTSSNCLFQFAYAGVWQDGDAGLPWEAPCFTFVIKDQANTILACSTSLTMAPGPGGQSSNVTYTLDCSTPSNCYNYSNWQLKNIDLAPYINSTITIEVISSDCIFGDHYSTLFFDAYFPGTSPSINFCSGSNFATIAGPLGNYSYQWYQPGTGAVPPSTVVSGPVPIFGATTSTIGISNPIPGMSYSLVINPNSYCSYTVPYTLAYSQTSVSALFTNGSCPGGSAGSATVIAGGSVTGYNYNWINATSSVVGTSSVVNGLAPGLYTVTTTASGSPGCGSASTAVSIGTTALAATLLIKPFCGNEAYLSYPGGSNYHWYNNLTPITASLGGTASAYTVSTPVNGAIYTVSYDNPYGCRDSLRIILTLVAPGILSVSHPIICPGASNGIAVISLSPAYGAPQSVNSYSVFSTGITPAYNATLNPTAANTFSTSGLSAGGTYSVKAFDGLCKYSINFSVTPLIFNYTVTPTTTFTLCPGNSVQFSTTFTSAPAPNQYLFSWSPGIYLNGANGQNALFSNNISPGTFTTITYSVVVTSLLANCSLTKTLSITFAHPLTPTISPMPQFCSNASLYSIPVTPLGGIFINGTNASIGPANGILTPSLAVIGLNTFTYANSVGTCVASASGSFVIKAAPSLIISGNTAICEGQSTILLANGADTYTWNNSSVSPFINLTPSLTNTYSVEGINLNTHCTDTKTVTVTVLPNPILTIFGDTLLCTGETTTLSANGANTYSWSNNSVNQNIVVSPITNTTYTLLGINAAGSCSDSKIISVIVSECTGIEKNKITNGLTIYPNPTNGKFFIETENKITILLSDEMGRKIVEQVYEKGNYTIDLSNYSNGVYFLKTDHNREIKITKLVKNN